MSPPEKLDEQQELTGAITLLKKISEGREEEDYREGNEEQNDSTHSGDHVANWLLLLQLTTLTQLNSHITIDLSYTFYTSLMGFGVWGFGVMWSLEALEDRTYSAKMEEFDWSMVLDQSLKNYECHENWRQFVWHS